MREWMSILYRKRTRGFMTNMLEDLMPRPVGYFDNFCRMSCADFEVILQRISPLISKKDTKWRTAVPTKNRLALTLRFLATVCNALIRVLRDEVKLPKSTNEWLIKAAGFERLFPHALGAIDGKHVVLESPIHSASEYINYKKDFSIVLLGLVDSDYLFMFADVGCQGRMSDGGVLRNSILWDKMNDNTLKLPNPRPLPGRNVNVSFVFVADSAFALSNNIMRPYPGHHPEQSMKRSFNRKLSKARVKVEHVFGIMTSVFRVFKKPMLLSSPTR
ncbi:unnamed protein product [Colias eurytheme]|nr:unnamed protein product [Colias eurytheme]